MNKTYSILSCDEAKAEIERLAADPIIKAMAVSITVADLYSEQFSRLAHGEYIKRGGAEPAYLGSPANAIREIVTKRDTPKEG